MWGFSQGIFWGWSHSVGLSNFETVFKISWNVTFQLYFVFKTVRNSRTPHNRTAPQISPRLCGGFLKGICWGRSHFVGLSNFETVFKNSWNVTHFSCFFFLKTVSKFADPTQWDRPQNIPQIIVGVFSRGYVGGGPIVWGCRISKQSLKTAERWHFSCFKDCFEIRQPHTMGPPPKSCGGFQKGNLSKLFSYWGNTPLELCKD